VLAAAGAEPGSVWRTRAAEQYQERADSRPARANSGPRWTRDRGEPLVVPPDSGARTIEGRTPAPHCARAGSGLQRPHRQSAAHAQAIQMGADYAQGRADAGRPGVRRIAPRLLPRAGDDRGAAAAVS